MAALSLDSLEPNIKVVPNTERGNLDLHFSDAKPLSAPLVSPEWTFGGRGLQFVQLAPGAGMGLDQSRGEICVKVIAGALAAPARTQFCAPRGILDTRVSADAVGAGPEGALLAVLTVFADAPARISAMEQLGFSGEQAGSLQWRTFHEHFKQYLDYFDGMDAYIGPGFHILSEQGEEITYVNIWTAGKGVDLSTHDHSMDPSPLAPAFAEVHWTIVNGTGAGGMYETPEPGSPERSRMPVLAGEEHGPFFVYHADGSPVLSDNGAVEYPWHGWQAGENGEAGQSYDVVAAFETAPSFSRVTA